MQNKTFDGTALEQALKDDAFSISGVELIGMVKSSEKKGHINFTRAGCETWVDLPISIIEKAEQLGENRCDDHSHPVFEITLKESKDPEAQALAALLAQPTPEHSHRGSTARQAGPHFGPQMSPAIQGRGMSHRAGPRDRSRASFTSQLPRSAIGIGVGGLGHFPRAGAWGCWDDCCESVCVAGQWVAGPDGWYFECDLYECVEPCERCIWPY
jgi:hypothetical protein